MNNTINKSIYMHTSYHIGTKGYKVINNEVVQLRCVEINARRTAEYDPRGHIQDIDEVHYLFINDDEIVIDTEINVERNYCDVFRTPERAREAWYAEEILKDKKLQYEKTNALSSLHFNTRVLDDKCLYYEEKNEKIVEEEVSRVNYEIKVEELDNCNRDIKTSIEVSYDTDHEYIVDHERINVGKMFSTRDDVIAHILAKKCGQDKKGPHNGVVTLNTGENEE